MSPTVLCDAVGELARCDGMGRFAIEIFFGHFERHMPQVVSPPLPHRKRCLTLIKTTNPTPQRRLHPARSIWSPREAADLRSADVIAFLAGHTVPREGHSPFRDGPRNCAILFLLG